MCDFSLLLGEKDEDESVSPSAVFVTDVYDDMLANAVIDPTAFRVLEASTKPLDVKLGTALWLLCIKLMQLAVDDRNRKLKMERRVMLLWLSLFISDSFVLHKVVQRNVTACILGYLYLLAFKVPVAPWRCSTHMQEYYHGLIRTLTHANSFTAVEFLRLLRRHRHLHSLCEENGWDYGKTSSVAALSGRAARNDKRALPEAESLSDGAFFAAAKEAGKIALKMLSICGWKPHQVSPWIEKASLATKRDDLVSLIATYSKLGGGAGLEPWESVVGANADPLPEEWVGQAAYNAEMKEVSKADVDKEKERRLTYMFNYDFPENHDDVVLSRLQEHAAALAAGHLTPLEEQWAALLEKHEFRTEVFPVRWAESGEVGDLFNELQQISELMTSAPGAELFLHLMKIGKHTPTLPRSPNKSSDVKQPNASILGRFVNDSKHEAALAAPKPEIMKDRKVGDVVIFGTEPFRVVMIVKRCGQKLHVCPTPREDDSCKLWLRKCMAMHPTDEEIKTVKNLRCVFADVMEPPVLAEPSDVFPLFTFVQGVDHQQPGFIMRKFSLHTSGFLAPPYLHRRNMNAFALYKMLSYDTKALTKELKPQFQKMVKAFMQNLKSLPMKFLKQADGSAHKSVQTAVSPYMTHPVPEIAAAATAILN